MDPKTHAAAISSAFERELLAHLPESTKPIRDLMENPYAIGSATSTTGALSLALALVALAGTTAALPAIVAALGIAGGVAGLSIGVVQLAFAAGGEADLVKKTSNDVDAAVQFAGDPFSLGMGTLGTVLEGEMGFRAFGKMGGISSGLFDIAGGMTKLKSPNGYAEIVSGITKVYSGTQPQPPSATNPPQKRREEPRKESGHHRQSREADAARAAARERASAAKVYDDQLRLERERLERDMDERKAREAERQRRQAERDRIEKMRLQEEARRAEEELRRKREEEARAREQQHQRELEEAERRRREAEREAEARAAMYERQRLWNESRASSGGGGYSSGTTYYDQSTGPNQPYYRTP